MISATSFFDKGLPLTILKIKPNQLVQPVEPEIEPKTGSVKASKKPKNHSQESG